MWDRNFYDIYFSGVWPYDLIDEFVSNGTGGITVENHVFDASLGEWAERYG